MDRKNLDWQAWNTSNAARCSTRTTFWPGPSPRDVDRDGLEVITADEARNWTPVRSVQVDREVCFRFILVRRVAEPISII